MPEKIQSQTQAQNHVPSEFEQIIEELSYAEEPSHENFGAVLLKYGYDPKVWLNVKPEQVNLLEVYSGRHEFDLRHWTALWRDCDLVYSPPKEGSHVQETIHVVEPTEPGVSE